MHRRYETVHVFQLGMRRQEELQRIPTTVNAPYIFHKDSVELERGEPPQIGTPLPEQYGAKDIDLPFGRILKGNANMSRQVRRTRRAESLASRIGRQRRSERVWRSQKCLQRQQSGYSSLLVEVRRSRSYVAPIRHTKSISQFAHHVSPRNIPAGCLHCMSHHER